jgi:hypothetical protein
MDANELFKNQIGSYLHLERYVNDGSPSGFTEQKTTSQITNPFTGADKFSLLEFNDEDLSCVTLGSRQQLFDKGVNYAHPDSASSPLLLSAKRQLVRTRFEVSPTASGRTMLIRTPPFNGYIKLTYDIARLGRVDRQLSLKLCQSSLEVTRTIKSCLDQRKLPATFALLLETSSKITRIPTAGGFYDWGVIFRETKPYPYQNIHTQLIPAFALFSTDRQSPRDEPLLNQFIKLSGNDPRNYLTHLLKMIVDCYFGVVLNCAFHPETHAQNCLFEVDKAFNIVRMVFIDMQSVDKDIPLARYLGLNDAWESYPEACLDDKVYYYNIRASFIYDFKVGTYLMSPIIDTVASDFKLNVPAIEQEIKEYVQKNFTSRLPSTFFPSDGCWYDCDKTERLPGQKRTYYPHKDPKFR